MSFLFLFILPLFSDSISITNAKVYPFKLLLHAVFFQHHMLMHKKDHLHSVIQLIMFCWRAVEPGSSSSTAMAGD